MKNKFDLTNYVKAGYPVIVADTFEIKRIIDKITIDKSFKKFKWDMLRGLYETENGEEYTNPMNLFEIILKSPESVFILENFNRLWESEDIIQVILNSMVQMKKQQTMVVIVGSDIKFPPELNKILTKIDFELPNIEEFMEAGKEVAEQLNIELNEEAISACAGLSLEEGENALALTSIENGKMDKDIVYKMKRSMIKKTGFMDYLEPVNIDQIGGLDYAKEYIFKRKEKWNDPKYPKLRSMLLSGLSGTGKSLLAKAVASIFNCPLILWDLNSCKDSLVGSTEKNMRIATKTIDACGMSVILVDK